MLQALDAAFESAQQTQLDKASGQSLLFGGDPVSSSGSQSSQTKLPKVPEFAKPELLQMEKDLVGFYVSSHPLVDHQAEVQAFSTHTTRMALSLAEGSVVTMAGMITAIRARVAKSGRSAGQQWAVVEFEDLEGKIEGMIFSEVYGELKAKSPELLKADQLVLVTATIDRKRETPCLLVSKVIPIEQAADFMAEGTIVRLNESHTPLLVEQIKPILLKHRGQRDTYLHVATSAGKRVGIATSKEFSTRPCRQLVLDLEALLGSGCCELIGPGTRRIRNERIQQQKLFDEPALTDELPLDDASIDNASDSLDVDDQ